MVIVHSFLYVYQRVYGYKQLWIIINHYELYELYGGIICHYLPEAIGLLWAIQDGAPQL